MSFISEYLTPLNQSYNRWLDGEYISQQLQYKGSKDIGGDYVNKIRRANRRSIQQRYDDALSSVKNPTFKGFLQDNLLRFLLNPFDRLVALTQAYPNLKSRFHKPGTLSYNMTQILNQGVFFGGFKGSLFNFAQLSLVLYPSVLAANRDKTQNQYLTFLGTYTLLDALFYPLDTLKNILYADTMGTVNLKNIFQSAKFSNLYNGFMTKLIYNVPLVSAIYFTTQSGSENYAALSWLATIFLYPLNTFKVLSQVSSSSIGLNSESLWNKNNSYRGVIPFVLLNYFIGYTLKSLFNKQRLEQIKTETKAEISRKGYD